MSVLCRRALVLDVQLKSSLIHSFAFLWFNCSSICALVIQFKVHTHPTEAGYACLPPDLTKEVRVTQE